MASDQLDDTQLRALVIRSLDDEPDAPFERVAARLRSREGRSLDSAETERLREAYQAELAHPTGAHRVGAVEAASIVRNRPFAPRPIEIVGLAAGLLPFILHMQTVIPGSLNRATGATTAGTAYDFVAVLGGFLAVLLGLVAAYMARSDLSRRSLHLALDGLIVVLGIYQSLLGLGLLHRMGIFTTG